MLLEISGLSRSTYYYHFKRIKVDKYITEKEEILKIFNANKGRYGYRRILLDLRDNGFAINHKTVLKLMQELGIKGKIRRSKYKSYKGEIGKVAYVYAVEGGQGLHIRVEGFYQAAPPERAEYDGKYGCKHLEQHKFPIAMLQLRPELFPLHSLE